MNRFGGRGAFDVPDAGQLCDRASDFILIRAKDLAECRDFSPAFQPKAAGRYY